MFREALIKAINENPEFAKAFLELREMCKGKSKKEVIKIIKKWQKDTKQVADSKAHQTN